MMKGGLILYETTADMRLFHDMFDVDPTNEKRILSAIQRHFTLFKTGRPTILTLYSPNGGSSRFEYTIVSVIVDSDGFISEFLRYERGFPSRGEEEADFLRKHAHATRVNREDYDRWVVVENNMHPDVKLIEDALLFR